MRKLTIGAVTGLLAVSGIGFSGTAYAGADGDISLAGACGQADLLFLGIDLDLDLDATAYKNMTKSFLDSDSKAAQKLGKSLKKAKGESKQLKGVKKAYAFCVDEGIVEPDA